MGRNVMLVLGALVLSCVASTLIPSPGTPGSASGESNRQRSLDKSDIFNRKRNAHACIMSIVFIVLFPLGAIALHLPIAHLPYLRNTYLKNKVMAMHMPIQMIAFVMMVGGMALGISIGHDLDILKSPIDAHIVIGLLVVCTLIVVQPIMGVLQHRHFKKTGGRSYFAYAHRWTGRVAIVLGMMNSGLGFRLAKMNVVIHRSTYVRNYVIVAILVPVWVGLVVYDQFSGDRKGIGQDGGEKGTSNVKTWVPETSHSADREVFSDERRS